jgi:putative addiction module component (TIGR02574 family)
MSAVVAELEAQIRSLSSDDRVELLRALISELDGPTEHDTEVAWLLEAQRRHREIEEGRAQPGSGEIVFENLQSRLGG